MYNYSARYKWDRDSGIPLHEWDQMVAACKEYERKVEQFDTSEFDFEKLDLCPEDTLMAAIDISNLICGPEAPCSGERDALHDWIQKIIMSTFMALGTPKQK